MLSSKQCYWVFMRGEERASLWRDSPFMLIGEAFFSGWESSEESRDLRMWHLASDLLIGGTY